MEVHDGLENGSRVAIIGGGVSAVATAAALLFTARARGKTLELRIFEGQKDEAQHRAPAILSAECRSRLSALGCRVPPEWGHVELCGVEVISGRERALLRAQGGPLWVVDAWPEGAAGTALVARSLAQVCALNGARFVPRRVERVEVAGRAPGEPAPQTGAGSFVVWAQGANERAHATVLAAGPGAPVSRRFFDRFSGAPTVAASQARLRYPAFTHSPWAVAKLILSPLPGMDALYLVPCRGSLWALGMGAGSSPSDLCQALMMAARDGHLPEGFEISHLSSTQVAAGVGRRLCAPGQLAVGTSAVGHPLQLTLSESLAVASRAAVALVDAARSGRRLRHRYVRDGIFDVAQDARTSVKALRWLGRAREGAAGALARAQEQDLELCAGAGVLGLSRPSPGAVVAKARWAALQRALGGLWRTAVEPLPPARPEVVPELYYVVDDDPEVRGSVTELLESRGAEVVCFADELALFAAVARRRPAAILLDVVLSWVDGLRLCAELKRHPLTRDVRVVMMSGLGRSHIRDRALAAGAESFLAKPVAPGKLLAALDPGSGHDAPDSGISAGEPTAPASPDAQDGRHAS
jgi:CheY-like chemotaxis protein